MWESTTKYFSPFFSYTAVTSREVVGGGRVGRGPHHT
jgi:hypothetical protein